MYKHTMIVEFKQSYYVIKYSKYSLQKFNFLIIIKYYKIISIIKT